MKTEMLVNIVGVGPTRPVEPGLYPCSWVVEGGRGRPFFFSSSFLIRQVFRKGAQ